MSIDSIVVNPGRLKILTALAVEPRQEFVRLRGATQMTDGNLATHARRLRSAGLLEIDKTFRNGKPVTTFVLTQQGRAALHAHVEHLTVALQPPSKPQATHAPTTAESEDENWID
jgi:DNA-binding MarR family transcriptional regulator